MAQDTIQPKRVSPIKTLHYANEARNYGGVKGRLIIVEGIDGSGKSTQLHLLEQWLRSKNMAVFLTEWNSSEMVKQITSKGKKKGKLTPTTFSLLHATDFADRYERRFFLFFEQVISSWPIAMFTQPLQGISCEGVV